MKALVYHGRGDIRCDSVPDPKIEDGRDAIIKVTACAICGSDLHLMGGFVPEMKSGDVLGHECMGEVVEVGRDNKRLKVGDRVVIPFCLACGECRMCKMELYSCCERSNRNGKDQAKALGYAVAGALGYSHLTGGYAGGQAEYARIPFADFGAFIVPDGYSDEQVLFLSDIFPTGYMAAENCDIKKGQTVAVFGCGPVGLFAIMSAFVLGAARVIAVELGEGANGARAQARRGSHRLQARQRPRPDSLAHPGRRPGRSYRCGRHGEHGRGNDHAKSNLCGAVDRIRFGSFLRPERCNPLVPSRWRRFSAWRVHGFGRPDGDGSLYEQGIDHENRSDPRSQVYGKADGAD